MTLYFWRRFLRGRLVRRGSGAGCIGCGQCAGIKEVGRVNVYLLIARGSSVFALAGRHSGDSKPPSVAWGQPGSKGLQDSLVRRVGRRMGGTGLRNLKRLLESAEGSQRSPTVEDL